NYVFKVLLAFEAAAKAPSTESLLTALVQALARFGHKWGRIYFVEGEGEAQFLVSKRTFGFGDSNLTDATFPGVLARRGSHGVRPTYWRCLDERKPVIFFSNSMTGSSLNRNDPEAVVISEPNFFSRLAQHVGITWLDFPLIAQRELGKITLQVDGGLTPD